MRSAVLGDILHVGEYTWCWNTWVGPDITDSWASFYDGAGVDGESVGNAWRHYLKGLCEDLGVGR